MLMAAFRVGDAGAIALGEALKVNPMPALECVAGGEAAPPIVGVEIGLRSSASFGHAVARSLDADCDSGALLGSLQLPMEGSDAVLECLRSGASGRLSEHLTPQQARNSEGKRPRSRGLL